MREDRSRLAIRQRAEAVAASTVSSGGMRIATGDLFAGVFNPVTA